MSNHCNFSFGWSPHYVANVLWAVNEWIKGHSDMRGTPLYVQMQELVDECKIVLRAATPVQRKTKDAQ